MNRVSGTPLNRSGRWHRGDRTPFSQPEHRKGRLVERIAFRVGEIAAAIVGKGDGRNRGVKGFEGVRSIPGWNARCVALEIDLFKRIGRAREKEVGLYEWKKELIELKRELNGMRAKLAEEAGELYYRMEELGGWEGGLKQQKARLKRKQVELKQEREVFAKLKERFNVQRAALAEEVTLVDREIGKLAEWQERLIQREGLSTELSEVLGAQQAELKQQQAELKQQQAELKQQQAELEQQQAELEQQKAKLKQQQAELKQREAENRATIENSWRLMEEVNQKFNGQGKKEEERSVRPPLTVSMDDGSSEVDSLQQFLQGIFGGNGGGSESRPGGRKLIFKGLSVADLSGEMWVE